MAGHPTAGLPTAGHPTTGHPQGVALLYTTAPPAARIAYSRATPCGWPGGGWPAGWPGGWPSTGLAVGGLPGGLADGHPLACRVARRMAGHPTTGQSTAGHPTAGLPTAGHPTTGQSPGHPQGVALLYTTAPPAARIVYSRATPCGWPGGGWPAGWPGGGWPAGDWPAARCLYGIAWYTIKEGGSNDCYSDAGSASYHFRRLEPGGDHRFL